MYLVKCFAKDQRKNAISQYIVKVYKDFLKRKISQKENFIISAFQMLGLQNSCSYI